MTIVDHYSQRDQPKAIQPKVRKAKRHRAATAQPWRTSVRIATKDTVLIRQSKTRYGRVTITVPVKMA
jgi:hypothetical protein